MLRDPPTPRIAPVTREPVRERLAGRTILLTGASGFLGKAVLSTLMRTAPEIREVRLLLRAGSEEDAHRRLVEEVLAADAFAGVGGGRDHLDPARLRALPGDLGGHAVAAPSRSDWAGVDVVVHCAATVSFEEPLDDAIALNSHGPARLLEHLLEAGSRPHFVHVSTAYVADRRSGLVLEDGVTHHAVAGLDTDRLEAEAGERREQVERESGDDALLAGFTREARRDASLRPGLDAEERAEELRRRWISTRLSREGRRRAQELGWPDTYALSKALGEKVLTERAAGRAKVTIVRPTIIESALRTPRPGWLEGIKVADPLILAYAARGLTHLPGDAANRIDIVPVDQVANACVAAAAHPPENDLRSIAVASSSRNPLAIGELAEQIRTYFLAHPLPGRNGRPVKIGHLKFVERRAALAPTVRREKLAAGLATAAIRSPIRIPQERMLRGNRTLAERVTRMVKIYGAYTELDCVFDDANARRLGESLHEDDRALLAFDTAAIDWDDYLQTVHLPEVRRLATA
jgi:alcohol-forming fatty acyl-CoA reductase